MYTIAGEGGGDAEPHLAFSHYRKVSLGGQYVLHLCKFNYLNTVRECEIDKK